MTNNKAYLIIEDGIILEGISFGADGTSLGELVFNTSMVGYTEILTDPSYAHQIITMTYSEIGNYGVNFNDVESQKIYAKGLIVKNLCEHESHYNSQKNLKNFLIDNNIIGISNVDTRFITKKLANEGSKMCAITTKNHNFDELLHKIRQYKIPKDVVSEVSRKNIIKYTKEDVSKTLKLGVLDFGIKNNIINEILKRDIELTLLPYNTTSDEILSYKFDALLLSSGPGDPKDCSLIIENIKKIIGKIPLFGICLGYQILALALNAKTDKLKFGHRGGNHPVIDLKSGKVFMTSQNHGYKVMDENLPYDIEVTHRNLNDNTIEGFESKKYNIKALQFHPEASPGPLDASEIFDKWINDIDYKKEKING